MITCASCVHFLSTGLSATPGDGICDTLKRIRNKHSRACSTEYQKKCDRSSIKLRQREKAFFDKEYAERVQEIKRNPTGRRMKP